MANRNHHENDELERSGFTGDGQSKGRFEGEYARDRHRGGYGGEYARDLDWSGAGRGADYGRDPFWGGTGAAGDWLGGSENARRGSSYVGYGPARTRSTYGSNDVGGSAVPYGETDPTNRMSFRGRGPRNWRPGDERIREAVNEMLTEHHDVDATDIDVSVADGEVTLTGRVSSRWEKRAAEDIAGSCRGVKDVHNRLQIANPAAQIGKASE
jgi:hypothetical protein